MLGLSDPTLAVQLSDGDGVIKTMTQIIVGEVRRVADGEQPTVIFAPFTTNNEVVTIDPRHRSMVRLARGGTHA